MGLFSNTIIDKGIASLFGKKKTLDENLKAKKENEAETSNPAPKPEAQSVEAKSVESQSPDLQSKEPQTDLEDEYVKKKAHKLEKKSQTALDTKEEEPSEEDEESADESSEEAADMSVDAVADTTADLSADESSEEKVESHNVPAAEKKSKEKDAESREKDAERTIFVKNVPNAVITDRKAGKAFKKLFGPGVKSVRYRSIAVSEMVPRKVAYIKQKLHPARDAVNSYIVYESKDRVHEVMNTMNGKEFMDHHLFVDSAYKPRPQPANQSVFIGNLSFEATEEQLYRYFAECGDIDNVRIVRDRKFNLGKGFAYVQFSDVSTVQLALLKNGQEFDGRPLRVTRCSKKQQKKPSTVEKSFKQKQTDRSRQGKPKRQPKIEPGTVLEGERAKQGDTINLGRKKRSRHEGGRAKKRAKKN